MIFSLLIVVLFTASFCNKEDNPVEVLPDGKITAKEKLNEVLDKARTDFSADARLAAIYGREVDVNGEIDLLNTSSFNTFVYVMQSSSLQRNEFYVPVYAAGPVKSPINFSTMLSLIKDSTAGNILDQAFSTLSSAAISAQATYDDSPQAIQKALNNGGSNFISQNTNVKIDMFLLPAKSIDSTLSTTNTADWVINFYSDSRSLVLWLNSGSNTVITLSGN